MLTACSSTLNTEAVRSSDILVNVSRSTRRYPSQVASSTARAASFIDSLEVGYLKLSQTIAVACKLLSLSTSLAGSIT
jgi:hypothetical protein